MVASSFFFIGPFSRTSGNVFFRFHTLFDSFFLFAPGWRYVCGLEPRFLFPFFFESISPAPFPSAPPHTPHKRLPVRLGLALWRGTPGLSFRVAVQHPPCLIFLGVDFFRIGFLILVAAPKRRFLQPSGSIHGPGPGFHSGVFCPIFFFFDPGGHQGDPFFPLDPRLLAKGCGGCTWVFFFFSCSVQGLFPGDALLFFLCRSARSILVHGLTRGNPLVKPNFLSFFDFPVAMDFPRGLDTAVFPFFITDLFFFFVPPPLFDHCTV